jgi:hypothetical protein
LEFFQYFSKFFSRIIRPFLNHFFIVFFYEQNHGSALSLMELRKSLAAFWKPGLVSTSACWGFFRTLSDGFNYYKMFKKYIFNCFKPDFEPLFPRYFPPFPATAAEASAG